MQRIYSLLRNNKQSGPYTLDELLHLNLKPFDLVWVEGKSGGWCYPSEIDVLKPFFTEAEKTIEPTHITNLQSQGTQTNSEKTIETNIEKENAALKAKHIYISFPAGTQITQMNISNVKEEEETPEAKLERKALELRNKIQAFTENQNQPKAANELDTKYARSLDDIKEEYTTWLSQQKKKKFNFSKKPIYIAAGVAALIVGSYFIFPIFQNKKITGDHILSAQEIKLSAPVFQQANSTANSSLKKTFTRTGKPLSKNKIKKNTASSVPTKTNLLKKEIKQVDGYLDSLNKKANPSHNETSYEPAYTKADGSRQRTKRDSESIVNYPSEKKESDAAPFEQLIKLTESINGSSPHLTLYNNSNKFIKFVAVDAYYYKANKKLLEKKTLYFSDISAKSSAKLFVPQEKNAASVRYEMGLISTDGGLYYAKQ